MLAVPNDPCDHEPAMTYSTLTPTESKQLLDGDGDWIYLDVRTAEEFESGHAPGAYNVPFATRGPAGMQPNARFVETVRQNFGLDTKMVAACASGGRSMRACQLLAGAGCKELVNMVGGFSGASDGEPGWEGSGFEVVVGPCPERGHAALGGVQRVRN